METFYAVQVGRNPGVYETWKECEQQIKNYPKPVFRKFSDKEQAEDFAKGIVKRDKTEHYSYPNWHKTGLEMAKDVIADTLLTISNPLSNPLLSSTNSEKPIINPEKESPKKTINSSPVVNRFNVWVDSSTEGFGSVSVYFGPKDYRNYSGLFNWKPPIEKTRTGLAAVVRAVSIVTQHIHSEELNVSECSLIIHTPHRYLTKAIIEFLKAWPRIPDDKNYDIYKMLQRQLKSTRMRIHCVTETDKENEGVKQARDMATSFSVPSFMV
jgi:hypothetical protein